MTPLQFFALSLITGIVFFCAGYNYAAKLEKRLNEYNTLFREIDEMIEEKPKTSANYDLIENKLIDLGRLRHKNKEMTIILSQKFWIKFSNIRLERVNKTYNI